MKLHYYQPSDSTSNFGDTLNVPIWNYYFPNVFNTDKDVVFLGIGTVIRVINKEYNNNKKVVVFGSGCHQSQMEIPNKVDIKFVRGPLSAKALGLTKDDYITDPAIVTPLVYPIKNVQKIHEYSYMPHFTVDSEKNRKVFESLGINYISPKGTIESIIKDINETKILLAEAMHGAIVADAYRIPWIPVYSYDSFNFFKWKDWSLSQGLEIRFNKNKRIYKSDSKLKLFVKKIMIGYTLKKIKQQQPYLSSDKMHIENTNKILTEIEAFKSEIYQTHKQ
tara:strand:+ start:2438 stop:3271 length:834 start_codon:yes stop_codon:yes gene_type:complete